MIKKLLVALLLLFTISFALDVPQLKGYVNDYAQVLEPQQAKAINVYLKNYQEETSNQIFILIINSLKGENLFEYSMKVAEKWRPGIKDKDNGVLLLVVKKERKIRIEVGYGLEGDLTDGESGDIIRYAIAPYFREGNFDHGVMNGVYTIVKALSADFHPSQQESSFASQAVDNRVNSFFLISIMLAIISWGLFKSGHKLIPGFVGMLAISLLLLITGINLPIMVILLLLLLGGPLYAYIVMLLLIVFIELRFGYYGGFGGGSSGGFGGGMGGSFGGGGASGSW